MTRRARLVLVALVSLAAAWQLATPPGGPPLYDGLGFPDEPYRFVQPPAGYRSTPAPTAATVDARAGHGADATLDAVSGELGPQVEIFISESSVISPANALVAHLRAAPAAVTHKPNDGTIWGNAYHLSAQADTGPAHIRPGGEFDSIRLRAPTAPPPLGVVEVDDGSGWRRLKTTRIGSEIYAAPLAGVGVYAVVAPPGQARVSGAPTAGASAAGASAATPETSTSSNADRTGPLLVILAAGIAVLGALAVLIRLRRRTRGP